MADIILYECKHVDCNKTFKTLSGRSKHHKTCEHESAKNNYVKLENGKIKCGQCDSILSELANYYRHNKNVHTQKKEKVKNVFNCVVCSKTFEKKSKL